MKKLYWWIQQINRIGGTEMVSIYLANHLCDKYDITIISTTKIDGEIPYQINPKIKLESLNIPQRVEQYDFLSKKYLKHFRIFSYLGLVFQIAYYYIFRRNHYRSLMEGKIGHDTLICSSIDTYLLAPMKGRVFFHYHFDSESFFKRDYFAIKRSRIPNKFIFLSKATMDEVAAEREDLKDKVTYIYNPIRFKPELNLDYNDNTITFIGRYAEQKNPILALDIAKSLKEKGFNFKMKMFGYGPLNEKIKKYHQDNHLEDVVSLNGFSNDVKKEIFSSDVLLVTSKYEGFGLAMSEANALSRPWVSSNWGTVIQERLMPGRNGIIVDSENPEDYANTLIELLNDKERLNHMKKASYEESQKLSKEAIIPLWEELLG